MSITAVPPRIPGHLPPAVREDWATLALPTPHPAHFAPDMIAHLPEPARRWLRHAIAPGTPLWRAVELDQHGQLRLGTWRPFLAWQILAPPAGFVWAVTTTYLGLSVHGFDRYTRGTGQMRHRVLGAVPLFSAGGPDLTRSAAARLASEIAFVPAAAVAPEVTWRPLDGDDVLASVPVGDRIYRVTLTVDQSGALRRVTVPRWARLDGGRYQEHLFAAVCHGEATFDGYTIPTRITAGWWYGTERWADGTFIQQTIDRAEFH